MNEKIINELKNAYSIKPSFSKDKFISSISKNDMSTFKFVLLQCKYLHSGTLLKSILLIIIMISISLIASGEDAMMFITVGIPFIALVMIYELETSKIYKMEELEQATRFSLKMLVLSRLLITGIISLICIIIVSIFTYKYQQNTLINIVNSFFLPYILTVYMCMRIIRIYRDTGLKYCFIVSASVSLLFVLIKRLPNLVTVLTRPIVSASLLIICLLLTINESKKYVDNMEECLWN